MRDLSLHILDIAQNSLSAGATTVTFTLSLRREENLLSLEIADDGRGMDRETLEKVTDPFVTSRTTRKVGLGLPLLSAAAERSGGSMRIESSPGEGTTVSADFEYDNIDRAPVGDLAATLISLIAVNPDVRFVVRYDVDGKEYVFDTREVVEELGGVPINNPLVIEWIRRHLDEGIRDAGTID
ncbi:MAG: ATP-binding protein [Armatimonadetes bacterium]|nr:ATP-binding protein [Armatimonadota bacterium]